MTVVLRAQGKNRKISMGFYPMKVYGFATMVPEVTDLNFARLEEVAALKLKAVDKRKLLTSLNRYLADAAIFDAAPNVSDVTDRLEKIENLSRELAVLLSDPSELGQAAVCLNFPFHRIDPNALVRILRELAVSFRARAQNSEKGKGGRPVNASLKRFLQEVGAVFDTAGGGGVVGANWYEEKGRYSGRLLELICELLEQAKNRGARDYSRNTVAQIIKELRRGQSVKITNLDRHKGD